MKDDLLEAVGTCVIVFVMVIAFGLACYGLLRFWAWALSGSPMFFLLSAASLCALISFCDVLIRKS